MFLGRLGRDVRLAGTTFQSCKNVVEEAIYMFVAICALGCLMFFCFDRYLGK